VVAIITPRTLPVDILFGWLFFISGIASMITTVSMRHMPGFFWPLISAILAIVAGMLLLLSPRAVLSVTLILIVFFLIEGIASMRRSACRDGPAHPVDEFGRSYLI
jgi:uncharacterized membrane protein HdeD (DUF308 family)